MSEIIVWVVCIIAVERATELVVESKIFEPLRLYFKKLAYNEDIPPRDDLKQKILVQIDYLLNCGYCVSVWVSALMAATMSTRFPFIVNLLFLHGGSNLYHVLYELLRRGRVRSYDIVLDIRRTKDNVLNKE